MGEKIWNILVLCTGNSYQGALLNHRGGGRIKAHSAGSRPAGAPHPDALAVLKAHGVPTEDLRSKHWEEFSVPGAPEMDVVLTVCDRAASEVCPAWPGAPVACHWGLPDPAAATGGPAGSGRGDLPGLRTAGAASRGSGDRRPAGPRHRRPADGRG